MLLFVDSWQASNWERILSAFAIVGNKEVIGSRSVIFVPSLRARHFIYIFIPWGNKCWAPRMINNSTSRKGTASAS